MIYEALRKELRAKRHRMTAQREIVLRVFVNSGGKHLGAEDVYRHLVAKKYKISKATVYRSVELRENREGSGTQCHEKDQIQNNGLRHKILWIVQKMPEQD